MRWAVIFWNKTSQILGSYIRDRRSISITNISSNFWLPMESDKELKSVESNGFCVIYIYPETHKLSLFISHFFLGLTNFTLSSLPNLPLLSIFTLLLSISPLSFLQPNGPLGNDEKVKFVGPSKIWDGERKSLWVPRYM